MAGVAVLSLLSNVGWVAYGLSAKAKQDMENRVTVLETQMIALQAVIPVRREMRDAQWRANSERDDQQDNRLRALEQAR